MLAIKLFHALETDAFIADHAAAVLVLPFPLTGKPSAYR